MKYRKARKNYANNVMSRVTLYRYLQSINMYIFFIFCLNHYKIHQTTLNTSKLLVLRMIMKTDFAMESGSRRNTWSKSVTLFVIFTPKIL